jgi:hypothetical protein
VLYSQLIHSFFLFFLFLSFFLSISFSLSLSLSLHTHTTMLRTALCRSARTCLAHTKAAAALVRASSTTASCNRVCAATAQTHKVISITTLSSYQSVTPFCHTSVSQRWFASPTAAAKKKGKQKKKGQEYEGRDVKDALSDLHEAMARKATESDGKWEDTRNAEEKAEDDRILQIGAEKNAIKVKAAQDAIARRMVAREEAMCGMYF